MQLDPIAILVGPKGRGSNMAAIATACAEGRVPARVVVVVAPKADIPAVENARSMGLHVAVIPPEPLETYGLRLLQAFETQIPHPLPLPPLPAQTIGQKGEGVLGRVRWVCLAGFTRLLPKEVLAAYPYHVLNIHPALLPKFGGKGMYGMHVHEAVLGSGDRESGCTVHFVNEQYDDGAIILQRRVPVLANDTPETLAHRVLEQEHIAYPEALTKVIHESRD